MLDFHSWEIGFEMGIILAFGLSSLVFYLGYLLNDFIMPILIIGVSIFIRIMFLTKND